MLTFSDCIRRGMFDPYLLQPFEKKLISELVMHAKGCLSLFSYFIDMSPTLMSPFFVKKHVFEGKMGMDTRIFFQKGFHPIII